MRWADNRLKVDLAVVFQIVIIHTQTQNLQLENHDS